jgi:thymidine phosphorylase
MVGIGNDNGVRTVAVISDMEWPLGLKAGNGLEVEEAVEVLAGGGPPDVVELTRALAHEMCELAGVALDPEDVLLSGRAMDKWREMIRAQGGDPDAPLPQARECESVVAPASGYLRRLDARAVGNAVWRLGAGRARKEDAVSPSAGVVLRAKPGDRVQAGAPLLDLLTDDAARIPEAIAALEDAIEVGDEPPARRPLVHERIRG